MIGHRALEDPRNSLVLEFVRIVTELHARTFVFENVKGLTQGSHISFLRELVSAFRDAGYDVRVPWQVLNAANFGVPQHRERLILMGARPGIQLPEYPWPRTNPADANRKIPGLFPGPTCLDALGDLPDADSFGALVDTDSVQTSDFGQASEYARELRCEMNDAWHFGYPRSWDRNVLTGSARTTHTDISISRFSATPPGTVEPISRFFRLAPEGLSNTLRAGTDGARGAFTSPRPIHYKHLRCITVREMARLHGFPDWFRFHATKWHGARQIGNSVPPPLARAVAQSVMKSLGTTPVRPGTTQNLGRPELLYMDMSTAAGHFSIQAPNGKRDRKSGARKRKQHEIEASRLKVMALCG